LASISSEGIQIVVSEEIGTMVFTNAARRTNGYKEDIAMKFDLGTSPALCPYFI
jgi:hypothetical protein